MKLDGKIAIVVNAASKAGKAIAHRYAKEGAKVVVADFNLNAALTLADELIAFGSNAIAIQINNDSELAIQQVFHKTIAIFGKLDILIISNDTPLDDVKVSDYAKDELALQNQLPNTTIITKATIAALPLFLKQGYGTILSNLSCTVSIACKREIIELTESVSFLYNEHNIRCHTIIVDIPQTTKTSIPYTLKKFACSEHRIAIAESLPIQIREEIADFAVFLGCDTVHFMNGHILKVKNSHDVYDDVILI